MRACCICGKNVSSSMFNTKDKYDLPGHAYLCKECGSKIGITNFWQASVVTAKKAKEKYLELFPNEAENILSENNIDNEKIREMVNSGRMAEAYEYVRDTAGVGQYGTSKLVNKAMAENKQANDDFLNKIKSIPNSDTTWTKKEVLYLETILKEDEEVLHTVSGIMSQSEVNVGLNPRQSQHSNSDSTRTWLLVLTNKRILIINRHLLVGTECIELPFDLIGSIAMQQRVLMASISIMHGSGGYFINNIYKEGAAAFVSKANDMIEKHKNSHTDRIVEAIQHSSKNANTLSPADEIKKYKELLDMDIITQDEFDAKKRQLLDL